MNNWGIHKDFSLYEENNQHDPNIEKLLRFELNIDFPKDYLNIMKEKDGFILKVISRNDYLYFWSINECLELNDAYEIQKYIPKSFAIGTDGGGNVFLYANGPQGFGLYQTTFGDLDINDLELLAHTITDFLYSGLGIEKLFYGRAPVN